MLLSLLWCSLVFFLLLSLLRHSSSSSSSSSSFSFFSFSSEVQRDMLSVRRLIVEWAPLSSTLTFIGPGRAGPPPIDQSQVTPFILLKSTCAEGLTRRHETECRHANTRLAIGRDCQNPPDAASLFILLKLTCAEGLTRCHETECRHATRVRSLVTILHAPYSSLLLLSLLRRASSTSSSLVEI